MSNEETLGRILFTGGKVEEVGKILYEMWKQRNQIINEIEKEEQNKTN